MKPEIKSQIKQKYQKFRKKRMIMMMMRLWIINKIKMQVTKKIES